MFLQQYRIEQDIGHRTKDNGQRTYYHASLDSAYPLRVCQGPTRYGSYLTSPYLKLAETLPPAGDPLERIFQDSAHT